VSAPQAFPAGTLIPPRVQRTLGEKVVNAILAVGALALVLGVAWLLRFLLLPVTFALLLKYVMGPVVDTLENRGLSRSVAVGLCVTGLLAGLFAVGGIIWPSLESWLMEAPSGDEKSAFELQLEHRLDQWQATLSATYHQVHWDHVFDKLREVLQHQRKSLVEGLPAVALDVLSHGGQVVLALIITVFVLKDGWAMKKAVVALVPNRWFENVLVMLDRVDRQIAAYLIGTVAENTIVTVVLVVPLWLLGMPNALLFAVIFGVANVIPFAGPFIGASVGLFFSLLDPSAPSLGVLTLVYVVVHFVDAMLISPLVLGKTLDMHPLTVIVGIAIGGSLGGVLGMLVIIPLIAVAKAIIGTVAEGVRNASTA
jgi:predicted PurR-regulated permease PerM